MPKKSKIEVKEMEQNNRGNKKLPPKKKFDFKCCKNNTIRSLNEVEYFLNNLHKFSRYLHLYKFFK